MIFRRIVEAIVEQSKILGHVSGVYEHPRIYEYVESLVATMPGDLKVSRIPSGRKVHFSRKIDTPPFF